MPRIVRGGLIQATLCEPATSPVEKIKQAMIEKHESLIVQAAGRGGCRSGRAASRRAFRRASSAITLAGRGTCFGRAATRTR